MRCPQILKMGIVHGHRVKIKGDSIGARVGKLYPGASAPRDRPHRGKSVAIALQADYTKALAHASDLADEQFSHGAGGFSFLRLGRLGFSMARWRTATTCPWPRRCSAKSSA